MKSRNSIPRLSGYLAATATLGTLATTANAAIVSLNVDSITGPNASLDSGSKTSVSLGDLAIQLTGDIILYNNYNNYMFYTGLNTGYGGGQGIAITGGTLSPRVFSGTQTIDGTATFSSNANYTLFALFDDEAQGTISAPSFGSGYYIGFISANGHYGWLEVTWDSSNSTFEILSGAYEDQAGVGILAGGTAGGGVSAIPEPSSALGTLGLLAAGMMIRRRGRKAA